MLLLVTGGAASGKSEYAEAAALALAGGAPPVYLATLRAEGAEGEKRVSRHRALRAGKGFVTCERPVDLAGCPLPDGATVLLECLTTLAANELFEPDGAGERAEQALQGGLWSLRRRAQNLIVVTNLLDRDGAVFSGGTARYLALLERVEAALASHADAVIEVVCGIPLAVKGELP